jgi:type IV pilus assembly protein PilA
MLKSKLASRRNRRGFTLIELLVVVLILAILMAVALPLYLSAVADSQRKTCRANLQTIANAVQAKYVKTNGANGYETNIANLDDLQTTPICPTAGTYSIATTPAPYTVSCTNHGAGAAGFTPGITAN